MTIYGQLTMGGRNTYLQNAMEKVGFRISTPGTGIHEVKTGASRG
jgi:hypothetical protein